MKQFKISEYPLAAANDNSRVPKHSYTDAVILDFARAKAARDGTSRAVEPFYARLPNGLVQPVRANSVNPNLAPFGRKPRQFIDPRFRPNPRKLVPMIPWFIPQPLYIPQPLNDGIFPLLAATNNPRIDASNNFTCHEQVDFWSSWYSLNFCSDIKFVAWEDDLSQPSPFIYGWREAEIREPNFQQYALFSKRVARDGNFPDFVPVTPEPLGGLNPNPYLNNPNPSVLNPYAPSVPYSAAPNRANTHDIPYARRAANAPLPPLGNPDIYNPIKSDFGFNIGTGKLNGLSNQNSPALRFKPNPRRKPNNDRKIRDPHKVIGVLFKGLELFSEGNDFIDSLYDALPKKFQKKDANFAERADIVYKHWNDVDIADAVKNLVYNHFEDKVVAKAERNFKKHFGAGSFSNWGRINSENQDLYNQMNPDNKIFTFTPKKYVDNAFDAMRQEFSRFGSNPKPF